MDVYEYIKTQEFKSLSWSKRFWFKIRVAFFEMIGNF